MNPTVPDALAHCLSTEGKARPVEVAGLGTFHVRLYGEGAWGADAPPTGGPKGGGTPTGGGTIAKHKAGVLFIATRELRAALAGESEPEEDDEADGADALLRDATKSPLPFEEWLARTSTKGPDWAASQLAELARAVRAALTKGEALDLPGLGRFSTKLMAAMTVHEKAGATRESPRRMAACFTPSDTLRRRLER